MPASEQFRQQAALLIRTIPLVAAETCFALKGGTAINLFVRDMPRLSVDIDLTYLLVEDRPTSLANIDAAIASRSCTGTAMVWPSGPSDSRAAPSASPTPPRVAWR